MHKYVGLFNNYLATALEYRAKLVSIILQELTTVGQIVVLWVAIYRMQSSIGGYAFDQTVLYYLLVPLMGFFTKVHMSQELGREIKDGVLSNFLLKPQRIWLMSLARQLAEKVNTWLLALPIYLIIIFGYVMLTGSDALNGWGWLLAGAIISGGFLMHFFLDLSIGWLAFWIDDVWSFEHFKGITFGILAGVSFPFEFLPGNIQWLFNFLPFKFLYYTPISYVLGKRGLEELGGDLLSISLWAVGFSVLSWLLWRRGLRKYEAFGN